MLDFDDMLVVCEQVFAGNKSMLRKYQERYDYVLTDESQDTSMVQHAIIEKLVQKHHNLCVVADEDQSLYSWRGAEPSYLLQFSRVYPDAAILFMEQNYRSSREIVEATNSFIQRNKDRYNKNMFTKNPPCKPIEIRCLDDYGNQAKYLVQEIQQLENLAEVAVLYRNHSSSIALMNEFDRAGIPFYMKDADNRFFSHWVIEDILNFMRMTFTDKRPDILEKIHLKFNGYISKQQMAALLEIRNDESVFDNLLNRVLVQDYAAGLNTMEEFAGRLKHLESALRTAKSRRGQNVVTFSTMHSAKGLEFDRVYLIDLVEGSFRPRKTRGTTR